MNDTKGIPSMAKAPGQADTERDLKTAREARGLSLNDIFQTTRVSMINLQALENGDFTALPPPVYTRNFIRKYARAVGVDEKQLLKNYERYLEGRQPQREDPGVQKPWPDHSRRYRFLFGSLAVVVLTGIFIYALILSDQSNKTVSPHEPVGAPSAERAKPEPSFPIAPESPGKPTAAESVLALASTSIPPASPAPAAAKSAAAPQTAPAETEQPAPPSPAAEAGSLNLVIEAHELAWLRITEGRDRAYQVLLKPGERIERTASGFFLLDVGNAGGVNLIFQGKPLGILGKPGQVVHLRLTKETAAEDSP